MTKHLIIIPGIGDDHPVYHLAARWWRLFGYTPRVYSFGWNSADPLSYDTRLHELVQFIGSLEGNVYLLGVSAGGSAAVNILASLPHVVTKVATLCAPLQRFSWSVNPLLEVAIAHCEKVLMSLPEETRDDILSVHAIYDPVVPTRLSTPKGIRAITLPALLHPVSIFLGLTILHWPLLHFFKQR